MRVLWHWVCMCSLKASSLLEVMWFTLIQHVTLSKPLLWESPCLLLSIWCNTRLLQRHPVAVLWEQVLCLSFAVLLVLWRSPAPDCLSEAHVPMFTRKHSVPLRICCSVFQALWATPVLVGMPGPRTPWDSPSPSGRWGTLPSVGRQLYYLAHLGRTRSCFLQLWGSGT